MKFLTVRDFRNKSAKVWEQLNAEGELVVTNNGRPIAILSPVSEDSLEESLATFRRARAMAAVQALQCKAARSNMSENDIAAEIKSVRKGRNK